MCSSPCCCLFSPWCVLKAKKWAKSHHETEGDHGCCVPTLYHLWWQCTFMEIRATDLCKVPSWYNVTELWRPYGWSLHQQSTIGNETHGILCLQCQDILCASEELPVSCHVKPLGRVEHILMEKWRTWQVLSGAGIGGLTWLGTVPNTVLTSCFATSKWQNFHQLR